MKYTKQQRAARRKLFNLLEKLDIKSANSSSLSLRSFEEMMDDVLDNFGQPDQLFMDLETGSILTTMLEVVAKQGAQNEKVVSDLFTVVGVGGDGNLLPDDPAKVPGSSDPSQP